MASAQINVRTSKDLLKEIDTIVDEGLFRNRTEAVNEALRLLIRRYKVMRIADRIRAMSKEGKIDGDLTKALLESREEDDG